MAVYGLGITAFITAFLMVVLFDYRTRSRRPRHAQRGCSIGTPPRPGSRCYPAAPAAGAPAPLSATGHL